MQTDAEGLYTKGRGQWSLLYILINRRPSVVAPKMPFWLKLFVPGCKPVTVVWFDCCFETFSVLKSLRPGTSKSCFWQTKVECEYAVRVEKESSIGQLHDGVVYCYYQYALLTFFGKILVPIVLLSSWWNKSLNKKDNSWSILVFVVNWRYHSSDLVCQHQHSSVLFVNSINIFKIYDKMQNKWLNK